MKYRLLPLFVVIAADPAVLAESRGLDRFGGLQSISFRLTGFFRTHNDGKRWWLVTPEGGAFLSVGVCCVHPHGDAERGTGRKPYHLNVLKKYGTVGRWVSVTRKRLDAWGFNTLACWSGNEIKDLPRTEVLNFSGRHWLKGGMPDFFSPAFIADAKKTAARCRGLRDDPYLIGYFLDNELQWAPDWRRGLSIFDGYLKLPADAAGKKRLVRFFRQRYSSVEAFAKVWAPPVESWSDLAAKKSLRPLDRAAATEDREAFARLVAKQYFRVTTRAVRSQDPNHLILGCRFVSWTVPRAVVQACGESCDVVTLNFYEVGPVGGWLFGKTAPDLQRMSHEADFKDFHELTGKPLMITEFGFRAMDSGMPNTHPPPLFVQPTVPTQIERAKKYEHYVTTWLAARYFVGCHWFRYMDEPKAGRFDGENGNYGLVNIRDEPYTAFVERIALINRNGWSLHRTGAN